MFQKVDIVICMKHGQFLFSELVGSEDLHFVIHAVAHNKRMRHSDPMGFHGMTLSIVVIANLIVVVIRHSALFHLGDEKRF